MNLEVRLFATLGPYLPEGAQGDGAIMAFPAGTTVDDVVRALGIPSHLPFMTVVNGHEVEPERVLAEGDVVAMFPPLAGG